MKKICLILCMVASIASADEINTLCTANIDSSVCLALEEGVIVGVTECITGLACHSNPRTSIENAFKNIEFEDGKADANALQDMCSYDELLKENNYSVKNPPFELTWTSTDIEGNEEVSLLDITVCNYTCEIVDKSCDEALKDFKYAHNVPDSFGQ